MKPTSWILPVLFALFLLPAPTQAGSGSLDQARTLFQQGKFKQAQARLKEARSHSADKSTIPYYLGRIALHNHERARAVDLLQQAVEKAGDQADHHYWLGRAYGERAKHANIFQRAYFASHTKKEFKKAVEADPDHVHARVALVMYTLQAPGVLGGSRAEAEAQAKAVAQRNQVAGLRARGLLQEQAGNPDKALSLYREATRIAPDRNPPHRWLAGLLRNQGRYQEAFAVYEDRMNADQPDRVAFYEFALTAEKANRRLEEAEERLHTYLERGSAPEQPSRADALVLLGQVLEKQGRIGRARTALRNALNRAPEHPRAEAVLEPLKAGL
ncbi:tetratricopeptide repeat protein [Thiohalorhabdus sp.]